MVRDTSDAARRPHTMSLYAEGTNMRNVTGCRPYKKREASAWFECRHHQRHLRLNFRVGAHQHTHITHEAIMCSVRCVWAQNCAHRRMGSNASLSWRYARTRIVVLRCHAVAFEPDMCAFPAEPAECGRNGYDSLAIATRMPIRARIVRQNNKAVQSFVMHSALDVCVRSALVTCFVTPSRWAITPAGLDLAGNSKSFSTLRILYSGMTMHVHHSRRRRANATTIRLRLRLRRRRLIGERIAVQMKVEDKVVRALSHENKQTNKHTHTECWGCCQQTSHPTRTGVTHLAN